MCRKQSEKQTYCDTYNKAIWTDVRSNKGKYNEKYKKLFYFQFYSRWISININKYIDVRAISLKNK